VVDPGLKGLYPLLVYKKQFLNKNKGLIKTKMRLILSPEIISSFFGC